MIELENKLKEIFHNRYNFTCKNRAFWCEIKEEKDLLFLAGEFQKLGARVCTITCYILESGHEIVYHFDIQGKMLNLKFMIQNQSVCSITPLFQSADWAEREMSELYGITIINHPNPSKLFLDESLKENILNQYISLSSAMSGRVSQILWDQVKEQGAINE